MNSYPNLAKIQKDKKKNKILPLFIALIFLASLLTVVLTAVKVYRQANQLVRIPSDPFPDVAENTMPVYTETNFKSLDNLTTLSGWYFAHTAEHFRGNIILVHHNHADRVQFGLDTADLFSNFIQSGFNVLAFDLRHSGRSQGEISSYGYSEYEDVIAAMNVMRNINGKTDFILFGVGTGTVASMLAWDYLPVEDAAEKDIPDNIKEMELTRADIIGFILDTPTASANDYICADLPNQTFYDKHIARRFVPTAVKATSGSNRDGNMISIITKIQLPILITRNLPDTKLEASAIDTIIDERLRLHPDTTKAFETAEPGHLEGFNFQSMNYLSNLNRFLDIWYPNPVNLIVPDNKYDENKTDDKNTNETPNEIPDEIPGETLAETPDDN
ncbi:MAG TPA: alpha/beta hydrolase [Clostridiaceae bacterium]|nr:alpha/beta hydrolase [Clostridiaceae bacterium]